MTDKKSLRGELGAPVGVEANDFAIENGVVHVEACQALTQARERLVDVVAAGAEAALTILYVGNRSEARTSSISILKGRRLPDGFGTPVGRGVTLRFRWNAIVRVTPRRWTNRAAAAHRPVVTSRID